MNKIEARIKGIQNRKEQEIKDELNDIIVSKIRELDIYKNAQKILLYYPLKNEVNTLDLMSDKKHFYFPITTETEMFAAKPAGGLRINEYGILEPTKYEIIEDIDLVICPLTAYDQHKNRVGFGKGYYDKYLSKREVIKIGVGYACQKFDDIKINEYDVAMDYIVNELEVIK